MKVCSKLSAISRSVVRINARSSRSAVSRSLRCASSSSTRSSASRYSSAASGLTGPSASRRRARRSDAVAQHVALALGELVLGGRRLEAKLRGQRNELGLGLGGMVAGLLRGDLGARHGIRELAQACLQAALLAGALAQRAGERLTGGAVGAQLVLHRRETRLERPAELLERHDEALALRRQLAVGVRLALEHGDPPLACAALALDAVDGAALRGLLTLELGPADRRLALVGRRAALLDQPAGTAFVLGGLGLLAVGGAQTGVGALALVDRLLHAALRFERGRQRRLLLLRRLLGGADQRLAAVAVLERALTTAARSLAQLTERTAPRRGRHVSPRCR